MACQPGLCKVVTQSKEAKAEEALAALLANTKRHQRKLSLVGIYHYLEIAKKSLGGLDNVAHLIGISSKMLKQFESVRLLTPEVKKLFENRKIDSVDIAVHLASFSANEQKIISREIVEGKIDSNDVRAIKYLGQSTNESSIEKKLDKVVTSKNIK